MQFIVVDNQQNAFLKIRMSFFEWSGMEPVLNVFKIVATVAFCSLSSYLKSADAREYF